MLYFALATLTISLIELIIRRKENEILEKDLKEKTKEAKENFINGKKVNEKRKELQKKVEEIKTTRKSVENDLFNQINKLEEELIKEKKDHKNAKQYKYRAIKARKERDDLKKENETLKKQNTELQEFVIFTNKVVSESDYAVKKEYKNSKVKCIGFKKVLENTIKEGHELFR